MKVIFVSWKAGGYVPQPTWDPSDQLMGCLSHLSFLVLVQRFIARSSLIKRDRYQSLEFICYGCLIDSCLPFEVVISTARLEID